MTSRDDEQACRWCGAQVGPDDERCPDCGRRARSAASPAATVSALPPLPPLPPPPRRTRRYDEREPDPLAVVEVVPEEPEDEPEDEPELEAEVEADAEVEVERRSPVEHSEWLPPALEAVPAPPPPPAAARAEPSPEDWAAAAASTTVAETERSSDEFVWPPPGMPAEEPSRLQSSRGLRAALGVGTVVVVALLAAFIASRVAGDDRAAGEIKPTELQVGQCFNAPRDELVSVMLRPCTSEHQHEVFAVVDHPASRSARYPGDDEILRFAGERCIPLFERYGGVPYEQANLADFEVVPTRESWEGGERRVICAVSSLDGQPMRGSVRGRRS